MKRLVAVLACGAFIALATPALADDASAQLGAGGIVFTRSADIRMAKEDLYISPKKVRIRFEFANTSGKDQDVVVAFPLPDLLCDRHTSLGTVGNDPVNFVNFTASVDGRKVPLRVEQKAMFNGKDVTGIVHAAGLPVNLVISGRGDDSDRFDLIDKLPRAKKAILEKAGIAEGTGDPKRHDQEETLWVVQTRFYWKQHFPAGKTVVIEHSYSPVSGTAQYFENKEIGAPSQEDWIKPFCIDKATMAHLAAMLDDPKLRPKHELVGMWGSVTDYILSTANLWKGPIGQFHLTLDKLDPKAVLSLCWKGTLKKSGPATFDFSAANFAPTQDIHMAVFR